MPSGTPHIILASGSPRRKELLELCGLEFEVRTSDCDESYDSGMSPERIASTLASRKAHAVADTLPSEESQCAIVLGADTIVSLEGTVYGKPADEADACRMLAELSGKTHQVITGVCIISPQVELLFAETTNVRFKELTQEQIAEYVATGEPLDKAGAYGIQGKGNRLVDKVFGDFDNVVGLPISSVEPKLRNLLKSMDS